MSDLIQYKIIFVPDIIFLTPAVLIIKMFPKCAVKLVEFYTPKRKGKGILREESTSTHIHAYTVPF